MIGTRGTAVISAHYNRMGARECEMIHAATLEILETVGVDVHDPEARALLIKGGARADGIRIQLPERMVEKGLATAPKGLTLFDRDGQVRIRARDHDTYYGGGSD